MIMGVQEHAVVLDFIGRDQFANFFGSKTEWGEAERGNSELAPSLTLYLRSSI